MVAPKQRFLLVHWAVLVCSYDDIGTQLFAVRVTRRSLSRENNE